MVRITLFILFISAVLSAQVDSLVLGKFDRLKVDSIEIKGNNITKDYIIIRELTIKKGDVVTGQTVDYNSERIFSLGIFNRVRLFFKQTSEPLSNILVIRVDESWYIYPIPFVRLRDKDIKKSSYGLYIQYKNFRGRNEEIKTKFELGYDPTYYIEYYNPIVIESLDISFLTAITLQKTLNKSEKAEELYGEEFSYNYKKIDFSIGKRLNNFNAIFFNFGFSYINIPKAGKNKILKGDNDINRIFSGGFGYVFDSRDLIQYPESGIYTSSLLTHAGFGLNNISYNIASIDYRQYQKIISGLTLKWRSYYRQTFGGSIPYNDLSYFGYETYVRGYKNNRREGNNLWLNSIELVHPIIKNWNISLDLPLLPKKLTSARVELYFSGFMDTGTVFNNNDKIKIDNFNSGYGFGFTILILPFNAIRCEYAFNEYGRSELIIGTGFSF
ncbi:MAG TPA: POTRA domain-containing protein [Melioribacteraceae bacterium]|nr:POTRA domain-containing protein [Melioribacteraceae bacterium]